MSLMGISVQFYAEAELLFSVEREAFDPPPQVRSALVLVRLRDEPAIDVPSIERFFGGRARRVPQPKKANA